MAYQPRKQSATPKYRCVGASWRTFLAAMPKLKNYLFLLLLLISTANGASITKRDTDKNELENLKTDGKIETLEVELQKLQKELDAFRAAQKEVKKDEKTQPKATVAQEDPESEALAGFGVSHKTAEGEFLNQEVKVPLERRSDGSKKSIGWQPLKKRVIENHMDNQLPKFKLTLRDSNELQAQLIETVENHLLDDLRAAKQYGIEPELILADLRNKNTRDGA